MNTEKIEKLEKDYELHNTKRELMYKIEMLFHGRKALTNTEFFDVVQSVVSQFRDAYEK